MSKTARFGTILALVATLGFGATAPAVADTSTFGSQVEMCTDMMLPPNATIGPHGQISMTMNGMTMTFDNFGAMVVYMETHQMCSMT